VRYFPARLLLFCFFGVLSVAPAFAQRGHSSSHSSSTHSRSSGKTNSSSKTVHVRSYTRKDGTVVRAYDRRPPGTKALETPTTPEQSTESTPTGAPATPVAHDSRGRIKRKEEAKREFERETGYPHGRSGYVVDHIKPLACGGSDAPDNMQWQTIEEAKAKDKTERIGCK
jgi:hypothetical protein